MASDLIEQCDTSGAQSQGRGNVQEQNDRWLTGAGTTNRIVSCVGKYLLRSQRTVCQFNGVDKPYTTATLLTRSEYDQRNDTSPLRICHSFGRQFQCQVHSPENILFDSGAHRNNG